jgi:hypothetical protein
MSSYSYFIVIILAFSSLLADEPIALVIKSRGNAKYKLSTENKFQEYVKAKTRIYHGSKIRTKKKAFTKIIYLDDRTSISVYPGTEITIKGFIENRMINKELIISSGVMHVNVFEQQSDQFKLITPHSELSCIECKFWVTSDNKTGDRFYKISGDGYVSNPSMDETMQLLSKSTILSIQGSEMTSFSTPITENKYLELLLLDADEI